VHNTQNHERRICGLETEIDVEKISDVIEKRVKDQILTSH
jgi:hypothetical protein